MADLRLDIALGSIGLDKNDSHHASVFGREILIEAVVEMA